MPPSIVQRANEVLVALEKEASEVGSAGKKQDPRKTLSEIGQPEGTQLSFFQLDDPILMQVRDEILGIDVNNLTPLEALNKLNEIKKIVK
jgi:DNA mismatch repair protein MutS